MDAGSDPVGNTQPHVTPRSGYGDIAVVRWLRFADGLVVQERSFPLAEIPDVEAAWRAMRESLTDRRPSLEPQEWW